MRGKLLYSILLLSCLLVCSHGYSQWRQAGVKLAEKVLFVEQTNGHKELRAAWQRTDNVRTVAILLDVSLGVFGAHRMYLGTDLKVPIIYTATVGGACVLWLVDLGLLICTKDITPYMNNPNVFMWNEKPDVNNENGRSNEPAVDPPSGE